MFVHSNKMSAQNVAIISGFVISYNLHVMKKERF